MGAITGEDAETTRASGTSRQLGGEAVGRAGVELSYEPVLHGQWGEIVYEVDSASRIVREISRTEPIDGSDIQLSIDLDVQQYAERLLQTQAGPAAGVHRAEPDHREAERDRQRMDINSGPTVHYEAPAGSVIVMNHETGQIVAMASYPTFDNRWFSQDISGERFDELFDVRIDTPTAATKANRCAARIRTRRASRTGRSRASTTWARRSSRSSPGPRCRTGSSRRTTGTTTEGTYKAETIDDWKCAQGVKCIWRNSFCAATNGPCVYGSIDTYLSLAVSSDAFYYHLGEMFSTIPNTNSEFLQDQVSLFSFGADTGVDLPYEFDGRLPTNEREGRPRRRGVLAEARSPACCSAT